MTVITQEAGSAEEAFHVLEGFMNPNILFRGHRDANWRLGSTLRRHFPAAFRLGLTQYIDKFIDQFIVNLASIGISPPFSLDDRRARIEYARHYGVPSPLIDFSHSPYVALFFAFDQVRPLQAQDSDCSAIYCLNIRMLADVMANSFVHRNGYTAHPLNYSQVYNSFLFNGGQSFNLEYPTNKLLYLSKPASWNRRMQRQLGVFLYDSLIYELGDFEDLEAFLGQAEPEIPHRKNVLAKIIIPHKFAKPIFERLEIVGATATLLYESQEGAAFDVINSYNYSRITGNAWDIGK